ncbi:MAG: site-2 protease family protein [Haloferacaceae archaeon]
MQNYTIGTVWGIPIRINVSLLVFLPVLAWLIGSGAQIEAYAGLVTALAGRPVDPAALAGSRWAIGIAAAVGLFVSVALHELGHAWTAMRYEIRVQSITLWILGGLAALETIPKEWDRELWIALSGPAVSVLVGLACLAATVALPASQPVAVFVVGWLAVTNLTLTVFNLLPAFPMDGGRVLRALLARSQPYATATRTAARVGTGFAIVFALVGVLSFSPMLLLLALFVYGAAATESRMVTTASLLEGLRVGDVAATGTTIDAAESLAALADRMFHERRTAYAVVEGGRPLGVVTMGDLQEVDLTDYGTTTVREVATAEAPRVDRDDDAFEALAAMGAAPVAIVVADGSAVGTLSREDYGAVMAFRRRAGDVGPF